jgi:hypothetical protein
VSALFAAMDVKASADFATRKAARTAREAAAKCAAGAEVCMETKQ